MAVNLAGDNSELAKTYDETSEWQFNNGKYLVEKLEIKSGDTVLDVGSGTGRLGRHVVDIIGPTGSYTGIDPLEERIRIANEKNTHPNAVFQVGAAEDLSFAADNSVDVVYLNSVFHWVVDKEAALREIVRVLKPGGKIGITTGPKELTSITGVHAITETVLKRKPYNQFVRPENSSQNQHGLTATELMQLLAKAGFEVKDVHVRAIKRTYATAEDFIRRTESSHFGNYLGNVPTTLHERVKVDIEAELEKYRTKDGIQFYQYMAFAVAQKKRQLTVAH